MQIYAIIWNYLLVLYFKWNLLNWLSVIVGSISIPLSINLIYVLDKDYTQFNDGKSLGMSWGSFDSYDTLCNINILMRIFVWYVLCNENAKMVNVFFYESCCKVIVSWFYFMFKLGE